MLVDLDELAIGLRAILDWKRDALCAEPDFLGLPWFPERGESTAECRAVCARCLVTDECLEFAMSDPAALAHGIWGGTTPPERKRMRREAA